MIGQLEFTELLAMDGDAWEEYVCVLLQLRYGPATLQRVPARDRGDLGLDAFAVDSGHVYQCYAPKEPLGIDDLYAKHRDKMTTDLGKFIGRTARIKRLLGDLKATRWVMVVPRSESRRIVEHASKKTKEVKALKLAYVADDFRVMVEDATAFSAERRAALASGVNQLHLAVPVPSGEDISAFVERDDPLTANLTRKLAKVFPELSDAELEEKTRLYIELFLKGQAALGELSDRHPEIWEEVQTVISDRTERLEFLGAHPDKVAKLTMKVELEGLQGSIAERIRQLGQRTADSIATGTICDWLMQCPLDFPQSGE